MPEIAAPICPCCGAVCAGEAKALVYPILSDLNVIAALRADLKAVAVAQELAVEAAHLALKTVPDGGHRERVLTMIDRSNRAVLDLPGVRAVLEGAKDANR